jgi:hypothetical protein
MANKKALSIHDKAKKAKRAVYKMAGGQLGIDHPEFRQAMKWLDEIIALARKKAPRESTSVDRRLWRHLFLNALTLDDYLALLEKQTRKVKRGNYVTWKREEMLKTLKWLRRDARIIRQRADTIHKRLRAKLYK